MKLVKTLMVTVTLLAVGSNSLVAAEREGRGGFGDRRQGGQGSSGRSSFMQNMNPEVREAMMQAYRDSGGESRELMNQMGKLRRELAALITSGEVDEKAIRNKVMAVAEVDAKMKVIQARMFSKMKEAGASEEMLKMMASRMGGGGPRSGGSFGQGQGGESMRRGFGGDRGGFSREGRGGFGDRGRPERGKPDPDESKKRRPEFDQ